MEEKAVWWHLLWEEIGIQQNNRLDPGLLFLAQLEFDTGSALFYQIMASEHLSTLGICYHMSICRSKNYQRFHCYA